jgi:hypothetical protein
MLTMLNLKSMLPADLQTLRAAKHKMEEIGWAMRNLNKLGNVIEDKVKHLPKKRQDWLQQLSYKVLHTVVKTNLMTMKNNKVKGAPLNKTYKALVTSSGILGGALGATAFGVDLMVSTKLMMRSIMDIARSEGEDLTELDTQLACLQVFALGGKTIHDDSLDTGYYASRVVIGSAVKGGTKALEGWLMGSGNSLVKFIAAIAARFSVQVSEKFVAQAIPVIGAAGGASINLAFIHHFQNMAHAHFSIRRLERLYGEATVKNAYEAL